MVRYVHSFSLRRAFDPEVPEEFEFSVHTGRIGNEGKGKLFLASSTMRQMVPPKKRNVNAAGGCSSGP